MVIKMENRLCLNKKPVYELPDNNILVKRYRRNAEIPNFEPNIVIVGFGRNIGEITAKDKHVNQIWIKTTNKELYNFIKAYDWRGIYNKAPNATLSINTFKKIILEEFYNKRV